MRGVRIEGLVEGKVRRVVIEGLVQRRLRSRVRAGEASNELLEVAFALGG